MIATIIVTIAASLFFAISPMTATAQKKGDSYRIESKYSIDSLKVSDLYLQAIREKTQYDDRNKAYSIFNEILKIDSLHAPTLYHIAQSGNDPIKSLQYIDKALESDPNNDDYLYLKVLLHRRNRDFKAAISTLDNMLSSDSKNLNLLYQKAQIYDESNMNYAALSTLDSAQTLFGKQPEILMYKQSLYNRLQLYDKAVENGLILVDSYPDNQRFNIQLAESYVAAKQLDKANEYFNRAKLIDSTSLDYQIAINEFYQHSGSVIQYLSSLNDLFSNRDLSVDRKIDYFNSAIKKAEFYQQYFYQVESLVNTLRATYPGDWNVDKFYARHLINSGKTKEAGEVYKRYLSDSTHQKEAYQNVIGIEAYLKDDLDGLFGYCSDALSIFKSDNEMKMYVSTIYTENNMVKDALKLAKECVKYAENDSLKSIYTGYIGDLYHQIDDMKSTYKYYDKALKLDPRNIMVLNNYSYFLSEEGRQLDKALIMSSIVMEAEPDNATYIDTYGWILYKLGQYEEAKKMIRRAIALDTSNNPELLLHLGDIFAAQGDKISAEMYWNRAETHGAEKSLIESRKANLR